MLLITCPWCGPREELEFRCGGESQVSRPVPAESVTDERWGDYLFTRTNSKGLHSERWIHVFGCRRWFNVVRNTVNHDIAAVYKMDESAPSPLARVDNP